jgi:hypothetical protein
MDRQKRGCRRECRRRCGWVFEIIGFCLLIGAGITTIDYYSNKDELTNYANSGTRNTIFNVTNITIVTTKCDKKSIAENCFIGVLSLNPMNATGKHFTCQIYDEETKTNDYEKTRFTMYDHYHLGLYLSGSYTQKPDQDLTCNLSTIKVPVDEKLYGTMIGFWCAFAVAVVIVIIICVSIQ